MQRIPAGRPDLAFHSQRRRLKKATIPPTTIRQTSLPVTGRRRNNYGGSVSAGPMTAPKKNAPSRLT